MSKATPAGGVSTPTGIPGGMVWLIVAKPSRKLAEGCQDDPNGGADTSWRSRHSWPRDHESQSRAGQHVAHAA